ncbi:MAG: RHS repeat-associated core domain-containing protein [Acidobacteriota bacterium]
MSLTYGYQAAAGASGAGTTAGNSGQLMSITGTINGAGRGESYTYDDLGRLASASGFYAQRNYSYDRWGNRTGVSGGSTQNIVLQQQPGAPAGVPNNRITSVNGVGYAYDSSGNLNSDGAHSYSYDAEGRIAGVDGGAASYSYDGANHRVKKQQGITTTYYIWEGSQVIAEYGNVAAGGGGVSYYLADKLSTRMTTDSNGVMKGTQDHLPFGEDSGTSTGQIEKHRFTSYERDNETGIDYAINRQYSQNTGRFSRPDPVTGSVSTPQSLNRYSYVNNDPINSTDPLGLESVWGLYRGTFLGRGGGSDGADYAFWGERIVDLPGFGTQWGSLSEFFDGQWDTRLQNTYDAIAANRALQEGDWETVWALMASNPSLELVIFQPILLAQNGGWDDTLKNIRRLKNHLWGDNIDSKLTKGSNGELGLEVHASFEQIVKVLKQHYYFGLLANNPFDHPGGMEFRDYSSPGFHFKLAYPKREVIGYSYKTGIPTMFGGNSLMSWITDFHGDRYNPNYSVYHLLRHFGDFLFR